MGVLAGSLVKSSRRVTEKPSLVIAPATGRILHVSEEGTRFLKRSGTELHGRDIRDILRVELPPRPSRIPRVRARVGREGTWIDRTVFSSPEGKQELRLIWQTVPLGWLEYWLLTIEEARGPRDSAPTKESAILYGTPVEPSFQLVEHPDAGNGVWKFLSFHRPLATRGGDVLFIEELDENHILYFLADVAGHHQDAVLVRLMLTTYLRIYGGEVESGSPGEFPGMLLGRMNHALAQDERNDSLLTAIAIILEKSGERLYFASAGHHPVFLVRGDGERIELTTPDIPLGIRTRQRYTNKKVDLSQGDRLLCYTDGLLTPGPNGGFQEGLKSLLATLQEFREASPEELAGRIQQVLADRVDTPDTFQDDVTFSVIVRMLDREAESPRTVLPH
jgi:hypothetical protein